MNRTRYRKRKMLMRTTIALFLAISAAPLLLGIAPQAARAQIAAAPTTSQQGKKIKEIEGRIMAPCCYTQTIRDHESQVAEEMREEVVAMVLSGKSEQEIVNYYRTKYGETILVVPDGMSGGLLTFTPVMIFMVSAGLVVFFVRRSTGSRNQTTPQLLPAPPSAERLAIQERIRTEVEKGW